MVTYSKSPPVEIILMIPKESNSDLNSVKIRTVETLAVSPKNPQEFHNSQNTTIFLKSWRFKGKRNDVVKGSDGKFILFAHMKDLVFIGR